MTNLNKTKQGPLAGVRIIEFSGIGPAPFACMLLSDMGADVVTIQRPTLSERKPPDITQRGKAQVTANLKHPNDIAQVKSLVARADVLVEGFRPGVMERLGLGPEILNTINARLIYARMTGWGQFGPLAKTAAHDINYIAITGALHAIGKRDEPIPPLNLVGDYGGGSLYLVVGVLAALHERQTSGLGQVIDAAITDGVISLMTSATSRALRGDYLEERESNMLDGAAPYYRTYETLDHKHVSVGAIEPQFFSAFAQQIGLPEYLHDGQNDQARWPEMKAALARLFKTKSQQEWCVTFGNGDFCVAPVLPLSAAIQHPHNQARQAFITVDGVVQPAPAPRFSRTPSTAGSTTSETPLSIAQVIEEWA